MGLLQEPSQLTSSPLQRNSFTRFITMTTTVSSSSPSCVSPSSAPGGATFSAEQIAALSAPLDRAKVKQREQGRSKVSYLEGWQAIAEANRIFGFDGWQRETISVHCVHQGERSIGRDGRTGWGVTYTARVRIRVGNGTGAQVIREGSGAGHGIDADLGQAHESAIKEAETDAMKRALMTFGNPFSGVPWSGVTRGDQPRRSRG